MENIMKGMVDGSYEVIKRDDGDYVQDGLLYCGKCRTPKQVRIEILGEVRTPLCLCKCEAEKRRAEDAERERERNRKRILDLRQWGFPDAEMQNWTFDKDDKTNTKLTSWARSYVHNFESMYQQGKGVVLYGSVGTGKTFAAACVANALIDQGRPALMTSFMRIGNVLQNERDRQGYLDEFASYDLLVIDDLGAERNTSYMDEIVFNVVDARYRQKKPLIITTNLTADDLKYTGDISYGRILSRLYEMCAFMEVKGKDRRRTTNRQNHEEMEELMLEYKNRLMER